MPEFIDPKYQAYTPSGIVDTLDGNTVKRGAMQYLTNLIPSPETPGFFVTRPAAQEYLDFSGFNNPGYVSLEKEIDDFVVGFVASDLNPGFDQPFVYDKVSEIFLTITGITAGNVPTSPATSGEWTPPTVDQIGAFIIFTHPGFTGANGFFGWLDFTGSAINLTGDLSTSSNPTYITNPSVDPVAAGITVGMSISGTGIDPDAVVVYVDTTTIIMSEAALASTTSLLSFSGGTATAPNWASGNTNTVNLPDEPTAVINFADRAYYACANELWYSDVLDPLNVSLSTNSLTADGDAPIVALVGQPFFTTQQGGIIQSLLALKNTQIWQVTGDLALQTLAFNKVSGGIGTRAPRSVAETPSGTTFLADDGLRFVDLTGKISPPNQDKREIFLNIIEPSRVAAAYNTGVYRICVQYLTGGVGFRNDFWFDIDRGLWTGPHTIVYDCITSIGNSFLLSDDSYAGQLLQSNVLPSPLDSFTELGENLSFTYRTVTVPEFRPLTSWTVAETSIFMSFDAQQNITATIYDQSSNVLSTYTIVTPFYAPSRAANWLIAWTPGTVIIPSRHSFQITGMSSSGVGLGTLNVHYQTQANANSLSFDSPVYVQTSYDFGLVTDSVITNNMDWGSVEDDALYSVDFESVGPIIPGPP